MLRTLLFLGLLPIALVANAQIVDMRNFDDFQAKLAEKRQANEIPDSTIDEKKLNAALERHDKRREDALAARRQRNANKSHVYTLTKKLAVPMYSRPFQAQSVPIPTGTSSGSGSARLVSRVAPMIASRQIPKQP